MREKKQKKLQVVKKKTKQYHVLSQFSRHTTQDTNIQ